MKQTKTEDEYVGMQELQNRLAKLEKEQLGKSINVRISPE